MVEGGRAEINGQVHSDDVQLDETSPFTIAEPSSPIDKTLQSGTENGDKGTFCTKLTTDPVYRRNYFLTLNLISAFFVLGWCVGQAGPSFLDLQYITNVNLDQGSYFFTAGTIGYLAGSLSTGIIFDKIQNKVLLIFLSTVSIGVTTAIIPWVSIFGLMVFVQLLKGAAGGVLDTSGNALLSRTWGTDGRMFMQALHFGFAFGGAVSPLAIAPFLIPEDERNSSLTATIININTSLSDSTTIEINSSLLSDSESVTEMYFTNTTEVYIDDMESILYIGFSISAAVALLSAVPIFISFIQAHNAIKKEKKEGSSKDKSEEEKKDCTENMTRNMKVLVVFVLLSIFVTYCAVEDTFMAFLSTFCVRQLKWTKVKGALITSAFWAAFALGRLAGIVLVVVFSPVTLIFFHATLELVSLGGIFVSAWFNFHTGMWICAPILGFAMSIIFPSVFTWTEESFLPVTGFISSLFLVGATTGSSVNPLVLGQIMEKYSDMWFIYLLSGEAVLLYTVIVIAYILSKNIVKPNQVFQDVKIEIRMETDEEDHRSIIDDRDVNIESDRL